MEKVKTYAKNGATTRAQRGTFPHHENEMKIRYSSVGVFAVLRIICLGHGFGEMRRLRRIDSASKIAKQIKIKWNLQCKKSESP